MRIAICFSGIPKYFEESYKYLNKNLISNFEEVDIFLHFWDINLDNEIKNKLLEFYKPKKYLFEKEKIHILNYPFKKSRSIPNNVFSMFYSIMQSNNLKIEYEKENNFKYDWVIRMRYDFAINKKIDIDTLKNLDSKNVYVNNYQDNDNPHCADCFGFSSSKNMDVYSNTYNNIMIFGKDGTILAGEAMLYKQLLQGKVPLKIFDVNHPFSPDYTTCWCKHSLIRNLHDIHIP